MGRRPFDEFDENDPTTWPGYEPQPAPWDAQPWQMPNWLASAQNYVAPFLSGMAGVSMPAATMFRDEPAAADVYGPQASNPEDDLRNLRMYRARQSYEQRFGRPDPWGTSQSVSTSPEQLLERVRQARQGGWRPGS